MKKNIITILILTPLYCHPAQPALPTPSGQAAHSCKEFELNKEKLIKYRAYFAQYPLEINGQSYPDHEPIICKSIRTQDSELFTVLIEFRANPNLADNFGNTPCHVAAKSDGSQSLTMLSQLILRNADITQKNCHKMSALEDAKRKKELLQIENRATIAREKTASLKNYEESLAIQEAKITLLEK
ncbi:MAG: hypothetical protein P4L31_00590 [Candidatus Babeliales bacterium]|nr:hypothetical protein [Candidatus Babeliales bacterium]